MLQQITNFILNKHKQYKKAQVIASFTRYLNLYITEHNQSKLAVINIRLTKIIKRNPTIHAELFAILETNITDENKRDLLMLCAHTATHEQFIRIYEAYIERATDVKMLDLIRILLDKHILNLQQQGQWALILANNFYSLDKIFGELKLKCSPSCMANVLNEIAKYEPYSINKFIESLGWDGTQKTLLLQELAEIPPNELDLTIKITDLKFTLRELTKFLQDNIHNKSDYEKYSFCLRYCSLNDIANAYRPDYNSENLNPVLSKELLQFYLNYKYKIDISSYILKILNINFSDFYDQFLNLELNSNSIIFGTEKHFRNSNENSKDIIVFDNLDLALNFTESDLFCIFRQTLTNQNSHPRLVNIVTTILTKTQQAENPEAHKIANAFNRLEYNIRVNPKNASHFTNNFYLLMAELLNSNSIDEPKLQKRLNAFLLCLEDTLGKDHLLTLCSKKISKLKANNPNSLITMINLITWLYLNLIQFASSSRCNTLISEYYQAHKTIFLDLADLPDMELRLSLSNIYFSICENPQHIIFFHHIIQNLPKRILLISILLTKICADHIDKDDMRLISILASINRNYKDSKQLRAILSFLSQAIVNKTPLDVVLELTLKVLTLLKSKPKAKEREFNLWIGLTAVAQYNPESLNQVNLPNSNIESAVLKETLTCLNIDNTSKRMQRAYITNILPLHENSSLLLYSANLKNLTAERTEHEELFQNFLSQVLNNTFLQNRYNLNNNPHLAALAKTGNIINRWRINHKISLIYFNAAANVNLAESSEIDLCKFLINKIVMHKHLPQYNGVCSLLHEYLVADSACKTMLKHKISDLGTKEEYKGDKLIEFAKIIIELFDHPNATAKKKYKLIVSAIELNIMEQIVQDLRNLKQHYAAIINPNLVMNNLDGFSIQFSDYYWHLFKAGIGGSCQAITAQAKYNKSLMSITQSGHLKLVCITNSENILVMRAILRLCIDETSHKPVAFLEETYSIPGYNGNLKRAIFKFAQLCCIYNGIDLTTSGNYYLVDDLYENDLTVLYSKGIEYVDYLHKQVRAPYVLQQTEKALCFSSFLQRAGEQQKIPRNPSNIIYQASLRPSNIS